MLSAINHGNLKETVSSPKLRTRKLVLKSNFLISGNAKIQGYLGALFLDFETDNSDHK